MVDRNVLVPHRTMPVVNGLEPWSLSELAPNDAEVFASILGKLATVSLENIPGEPQIYVVDDNRVSFAQVDEISLKGRGLEVKKEFAKNAKGVLSGFGNDERINDYGDLQGEILARSLHLALGRACLFKAILSESRQEFSSATTDLNTIFSITKHPIYDASSLDFSVGERGLIYKFKQAAKTYKTISPEVADTLVTGMSRAFFGGLGWMATAGQGLKGSIGYEYGKRRSSAREPDTIFSPEMRQILNDFIDEADLGSGSALKFTEQYQSKIPGNFINFVNGSGLSTSRSLRHEPEGALTELYDRYIKCESKMPIAEDHSSLVNVVNNGVRAYLISRSDKNKVADNIYEALRHHRMDDMRAFILAGNLVERKLLCSKYGKDSLKSAKMLGFDNSVAPDAFTSIRKATTIDRHMPKETPISGMLGDLIQRYLDNAFSE